MQINIISPQPKQEHNPAPNLFKKAPVSHKQFCLRDLRRSPHGLANLSLGRRPFVRHIRVLSCKPIQPA